MVALIVRRIWGQDASLQTQLGTIGATRSPSRHSRTVRRERQHTALISSIPVRELAQLAWCGVGAGRVMAVTANRWAGGGRRHGGRGLGASRCPGVVAPDLVAAAREGGAGLRSSGE